MAGHADAEVVAVAEQPLDTSGDVTELALRLHGAVDPQEQDPDLPPAGPALIRERRGHGQVHDTVAIDVAQGS